MLRRAPAFLVVLVACVSGCAENTKRLAGKPLPGSVQAFLRDADHLELLSLHPGEPEAGHGDWKEGDEPGRFHGWRVLGSASIEGKAQRDRLLAALDKAMAESSGAAPSCFWPRHGFHATHGDRTVDLLVCFQCSQVEMYAGGGAQFLSTTSQSAEPVFDELLQAAGVPLAPKPKR